MILSCNVVDKELLLDVAASNFTLVTPRLLLLLLLMKKDAALLRSNIKEVTESNRMVP